MHPTVAALHEAIHRLGALDPDTLDDAELHQALIAARHAADRLELAVAPLLRAWDQRRVWADNGSLSAAARLARETHSSPESARRHLRRARDATSMPATAAAVQAGRCSLDHVDLLHRCLRNNRAERFRAGEAALVETVAPLMFEDAVKAVAYWCRRADAAGDDDDPPPACELRVSSTIDGTVALDGVFDAVSGAVVTNELDRLERQLYLQDRRNGCVRTTRERRAAALVEMAVRSATAPSSGRRPAPLFTVKLGDDSFHDLCEVAGQLIDPRLLTPWLTEALYETVLFDGRTTVVSVSQQRTVRGVLRRAIEARDDHCGHSAGCTIPAHRCDVDHIRPAADGGPTSQFNTHIECPPHNRHDHRRRHDTTTPAPPREITRLDELRVKIRWRNRHYFPPDDEDA